MATRTVVPATSENDLTYEVASDLSARQYTFVVINSSEQLADGAAGAAHPGILQDKPNGATTATIGTIRVGGTSKLKLSDTVSAGQFIKAANDGTGVPVASNNDIFCAQALSDGVTGDLIAVKVCTGYYGV